MDDEKRDNADREAALSRFITQQRRERQFISGGDIVDEVLLQHPWKKMEDVYFELAGSLAHGEFEPVEGEFGHRGFKMTSPDPYRLHHKAVMANVWFPREQVRRWMERRGYNWPKHFEPE